MDTDREYEIAMLEIQEENILLIEQFKLEQLGKRAQRMQNAGETEVATIPANEQPPVLPG